MADRPRIAIREATEEEALGYGRFGGSAISRFLIVSADDPDKALQYGGNLGRGEGGDWLLYTIREARRWERRGYKLVLTAEQKMIEAVGKTLDLNAWLPPSKIADDPPVAVAKFDRICRIVCPEAFMGEGRAEQVRRQRMEGERRLASERRRPRREALDG